MASDHGAKTISNQNRQTDGRAWEAKVPSTAVAMRTGLNGRTDQRMGLTADHRDERDRRTALTIDQHDKIWKATDNETSDRHAAREDLRAERGDLLIETTSSVTPEIDTLAVVIEDCLQESFLGEVNRRADLTGNQGTNHHRTHAKL
jgi:hypothetical protein